MPGEIRQKVSRLTRWSRFELSRRPHRRGREKGLNGVASGEGG
jgi:hypothetical protein